MNTRNPQTAPGRTAGPARPAQPPVERVVVTRVTSEERKKKLEQMLAKRVPKFMEVAPAGFGQGRVERLLAQAAIQLHDDARFLRCDTASIFIAVRHAVELGLELAGAMPGAWLIPYWDKHKRQYSCELMIGYQGMVDLAYRAGIVKLIESRVVYGEDEFEIDYGRIDKPLTHKPMLGTDRGEIDGAYAMAFLDGVQRPVIEWMPVEEIYDIRDKSKSREVSAWDTHFAEMARKCPIRRIFKFLPKSQMIDRALEIDRRTDGLAALDAPPAPTTGKPSNTDVLRSTLGGGGSTPADRPALDRTDAQPPPADDECCDIREEDIPY